MWRILKLFLWLAIISCINSSQLDDPDICSFYRDEVEPILQCGSEGYPLSYGYKYCQAFSKAYPMFDDLGKVYVNGTRKCLVDSLRPYIHQPGMDCDTLKRKAFENHVQCYLDNHFCDMVHRNILPLFSVLDLFEDFLFTKDMNLALTQVVNTFSSCAKGKLLTGWKSLKYQMNRGMNYVTDNYLESVRLMYLYMQVKHRSQTAISDDVVLF